MLVASCWQMADGRLEMEDRRSGWSREGGEQR